jgi:DNA invertase Pin-like site-specific DNA recombinase
VEALDAAGCEKLYQERRSGRTAVDRVELARALDQMRRGDTRVVCRLARLARSVSDLHRIIELLNAAGVMFRCLQQDGVDTATSTGKHQLAILGAVAEFENDIRRERQGDRIEGAKDRGVYRGRPRSIDAKAIRALRSDRLGPSAIARKLGIARASV